MMVFTMVIRMRHTRAHTANRRSHHALKNPALVRDTESGIARLSHHASKETGMYNGRVVKSLQKKIDRKLKRIQAKSKDTQGK
ncbi:MAG TPA: 50S ribosomal protein L32 [Candidatus Paceibacterota bacterium]|nr:50S ribosomal protein L32 [Candidatus Paceibacterota bacterium]